MESSSTCSYQETEIPKMPLFEKPLTPSDVGKLNRLVIPKQHAENHFPSLRNNDDDRNGSLLSFEDDHHDDGGGCERTKWKFRYSYWNSSQSYVLTRGWSRFVKEKGLCAGDIVVFSRHRSDARRLFIGWRSGKTTSSRDQTQSGRQCSCLRSSEAEHVHDDAVLQNGKIKASGISKKLRLFGVNLECPLSSEPSTSDGSPILSQQGQVHPYHQYYTTNNYGGYMEINFSGSGYIYHHE